MPRLKITKNGIKYQLIMVAPSPRGSEDRVLGYAQDLLSERNPESHGHPAHQRAVLFPSRFMGLTVRSHRKLFSKKYVFQDLINLLTL
jgi:hypothetical protein